MRCAVMQPFYIPWIGYFDLIDRVDKFVFLDDAKLERHSWHVRNRIKTAQGELYLTIPVRRTKSRDKLMINEAVINDNQSWRKKHLKSIFINYRKSEFFNKVYPFLEKLIDNKITMLSHFNINIIISLFREIGIKKNFFLSSKMKNLWGKKDKRVVAICQKIGSNEYLSPQGAATYIETNSAGGEFPKNKIDLFYQNYKHPIYNQLYGKFLSQMSIIDLIFNYGFDQSLKIIRNGRQKPISYLSFRKG